jgi:hypothetical protein
MSDDSDWDFANSDDAKAEIRAAVEYLLRDTSNANRADLVLELIQIVRDAANRRFLAAVADHVVADLGVPSLRLLRPALSTAEI